jgi:histidine phosphotransfer protein HptB
MSTNSINLETLNELKEIMEDEFEELVSVFVSDSLSQINELSNAINSSSASDIRRIAHTLKGSSSNFRAQPLSEICKVLELNAVDNKLDDVNEILEKIITEYEAVKAALKENY